MDKKDEKETYDFFIKVLGKTLEHLGAQMYKRRDTAIIEIVANSWDAGATEINIEIPDEAEYDRETSVITIRDNGIGMVPEDIQSRYLVVGRNRRLEEEENEQKRLPIGRKGIGKLAGFGIANNMRVTTWKNNEATEFCLNIKDLKRNDEVVDNVKIIGTKTNVPKKYGDHGTIVELFGLKHKSPVKIPELHEALARRYSRRVKGEMTIKINGEELREPNLNIVKRFPEESDYKSEQLPNGDTVKYNYAFSDDTIKSKELRGFVIYVREKTAQAPPFFFNVEATASGQYSTRYVTGEINADFLDKNPKEEGDLISTDRQEIDWEMDEVTELYEWGQKLTRRILRECADLMGKELENWILADVGFNTRISRLEPQSRKQITGFLRKLGKAVRAKERSKDLADSLIQAYEFRQFHDVVKDIEAVSEDPAKLAELLGHLKEWQVLESRALLEIIKGRLEVISKFREMLFNEALEIAHVEGQDNIHDLLARYPWLLNPEWQVLSEEKYISTQLKEWGMKEIEEADWHLRYDFLALTDEEKLVIIEIKRPGHAVEHDELQRLAKYKQRLSRGTAKQLFMLLVCDGNVNVNADEKEAWVSRRDAEILMWGAVFERVERQYNHYKAILERNVTHPDFADKTEEILQTRRVLKTGSSYRDKEERAEARRAKPNKRRKRIKTKQAKDKEK